MVDDKRQEKATTKKKSEVESSEQSIKERLKIIMELDPENGQEKVSLFVARMGLREFPLAVSGILGRSESFKNYGKIELLGTVWRALIVAWTYDQKIGKTASHAVQIATTAITASAVVPEIAFFAFYTAAVAAAAAVAKTAAVATDAVQNIADFTTEIVHSITFYTDSSYDQRTCCSNRCR